jgi:glyoxylate carboligase
MFWAFMAALLAVPVGVFVIRPRLAKLFDKDFQGVKIEAIVGPIITLTVFLAAFVVAQATQTYQRAGQNAIGHRA